MKKKLTFFQKMRIFFRWMRQQEGFGLITTCSICKSTRVGRLSSRTYEEYGDNGEPLTLYYAHYKCKDCGATATAKEIWRK